MNSFTFHSHLLSICDMQGVTQALLIQKREHNCPGPRVPVRKCYMGTLGKRLSRYSRNEELYSDPRNSCKSLAGCYVSVIPALREKPCLLVASRSNRNCAFHVQ